MFASQSTLGLTAAGLYAVALLACWAAGFVAVNNKQSSDQVRNWLLIALMFFGLILSRALDIEEGLRQGLRNSLLEQKTYADRRDIQRPIAAGMIMFGTLIGVRMIYHFVQHTGSRLCMAVAVATFAALAMLLLLALRIVSLNAVDAVLFGPLKVNWITDIGASVFVIAAALYYVRLLLARH